MNSGANQCGVPIRREGEVASQIPSFDRINGPMLCGPMITGGLDQTSAATFRRSPDLRKLVRQMPSGHLAQGALKVAPGADDHFSTLIATNMTCRRRAARRSMRYRFDQNSSMSPESFPMPQGNSDSSSPLVTKASIYESLPPQPPLLAPSQQTLRGLCFAQKLQKLQQDRPENQTPAGLTQASG